jgi:predicted anti-sigma-YlaC factor YlaD
MKPHFSEADLLETYYMRPGESMPVMMHLADCPGCAARYERLEGKMKSLRSCAHDEKPETFWARQRISVMRRIEARRERTPLLRMAAAAIVVLVLGGVVAWDGGDGPVKNPQVVQTSTQSPLPDDSVRPLDDSPWASDELQDYSTMVAWESWVENGDQS